MAEYDGNIKLGVGVSADDKSIKTSMGGLVKSIASIGDDIKNAFKSAEYEISAFTAIAAKYGMQAANAFQDKFRKALDKNPLMSQSDANEILTSFIQGLEGTEKAVQKSAQSINSMLTMDTALSTTEELYTNLRMLEDELTKLARSRNTEQKTQVDAKIAAIQKELFMRELDYTADKDYMPAYAVAGEHTLPQLQNSLNAVSQAIEEVHTSMTTLDKDSDEFKEMESRAEFLENQLAVLSAEFEKVSAEVANFNEQINATSQNTSPLNSAGIVRNTELIQAQMDIMEKYGKDIADAFVESYQQSINKGEISVADAVKQFLKNVDTLKDGTKEPMFNMDVENQALVDARENLAQILEQKKQMEAAGLGEGHTWYDAMLVELKEAREELERLRIEAKKTAEGMDATISNQQLVDAKNTLRELTEQKKRFEEVGIGEGYQAYDELILKLKQANAEYEKIKRSTEGLDDSVKLNIATKAITKLNGIIRNTFHSVGALMKRFNVLGRVGSKSGTDISKMFKKTLVTFLKLTFGVRGLFTLFRKLRTSAIQAIGEIAKRDEAFNTKLTETTTLMSTLKGATGAMIQPLVSALLPVVNKIVEALTLATNTAARFFAVMTGQGFIYKAIGIQKDYAKSLKGTGNAAKSAAKDLMGFDEINRLSGDSGAGGADYDYEKEMIDTESAISKLAQMVKEAWKLGDFTELGAFLANTLKNSLMKFNSWITGKGMSFAKKIGKSFATLLNGIFGDKGLADEVGTAIGNLFNVVIGSLSEFAGNTDWKQLGTFFATTLMKAFDSIDWSSMGTTIGTFIRGLFDAVYNFVTGIDFQKIGDSLATGLGEALSAIGAEDETGLTGWQKLGKSISDGIKGIIEVGKITLDENKSEIGQAIADFIGSIDFGSIAWNLVGLVSAFVGALGSAFAEFTETHPLVAGIAAMLGLAIGGLQITELIVPLIPLLGQLGVSVETIVGIGTNLLKVFGGITLIIGGLITAGGAFFSMWTEGFSWVKEAIMLVGIALTAIGAIILGAPALIVGVVAAIVAVVATVVIAIKEHWNEITTFLTVAWAGLKAGWTDFWTGFADGAKKGINAIIGFINSLISSTTGAINTVIGLINLIDFDLPDVFGGGHIGFNIKPLTAPQIPLLAKGAVLPPNNPFLAMVGDQTSGTNIEAPLSTIQEAVAAEMGEFVEAMMAGFEAVVRAIDEKDLDVNIGDSAIGRAAERYSKKQTLVRGK